MTSRIALHLITDPDLTPDHLTGQVHAALCGGVDWVQVRHKGGSAAAIRATALALQAAARDTGTGLLINDRLDVALATNADGAHLAGDSLPPDAARQLLGAKLLGMSVHSVCEAQRAASADVDYVTFGHVFPTTSKPDLPPRGLDALADIVAAIDVPVVAIGGITAANVAQVLQTGCAGVAVRSTVLLSPHPDETARALRAEIDNADAKPRVPFPAIKERSGL